MYSLNDFWIKNPLFDFIHTQGNVRLNQVEDAKQQPVKIKGIADEQLKGTAEAIATQMKYLNIPQYLVTENPDNKAETKEEREKRLLNEIAMNIVTFQENYLAEFDVSNSCMAKILISIQHLGSNNSPIQNAANNEALKKAIADANTAVTTYNAKTPKTETDLVNLNNTLDVLARTYKAYVLPPSTISWTKEDVLKATNSPSGEVDSSYVVSDTLGLIVAVSSLPGKIDLVRETMVFSRLLTLISNDECKPLEVQQGGGNNRKRKYIVGNSKIQYIE